MNEGFVLFLVAVGITVIFYAITAIRGKRFAKKSFPLTLRLLERFKQETAKGERVFAEAVFIVSERYVELSVEKLSGIFKDCLDLADGVPFSFFNSAVLSANMDNIKNWEQGVAQNLLKELEEGKARFTYFSFRGYA